MQQRPFLLGLAAPPRGKRSYQNWPGSVISQPNANPSITGLAGTLKTGNVLHQDLLTRLCSHDSQSPRLSSPFQRFMAVGGF